MTEQLEKKMSEEETQEETTPSKEAQSTEKTVVDTGRKIDVSKVMLKKNMVRTIEKKDETQKDASAESKVIIIPRAALAEPKSEAPPRPRTPSHKPKSK